ncbi:MAG: hypothetical protein ACK2T3_02165, partial [Candidatus Promineifilaceae bacterium]
AASTDRSVGATLVVAIRVGTRPTPTKARFFWPSAQRNPIPSNTQRITNGRITQHKACAVVRQGDCGSHNYLLTKRGSRWELAAAEDRLPTLLRFYNPARKKGRLGEYPSPSRPTIRDFSRLPE